MNAKIEEVKRFIKKHKKGIIIVSTVVVCGVVIYITRDKIREASWKRFCDKNMLMYDNGLPVFANDEWTKVYSDAIAPNADIQSILDAGIEIVERA